MAAMAASRGLVGARPPHDFRGLGRIILQSLLETSSTPLASRSSRLGSASTAENWEQPGCQTRPDAAQHDSVTSCRRRQKESGDHNVVADADKGARA